MDAPNALKRQLITGLAEKIDALIEAVEQRYVHVRLHDFKHHSRESGARSYVDDLFIRKIADRQQRRAVEKMQTGDILCAAYGGEIHDAVALLKIFIIRFKPADRFGIGHNAERGKAVV